MKIKQLLLLLFILCSCLVAIAADNPPSLEKGEEANDIYLDSDEDLEEDC